MILSPSANAQRIYYYRIRYPSLKALVPGRLLAKQCYTVMLLVMLGMPAVRRLRQENIVEYGKAFTHIPYKQSKSP